MTFQPLPASAAWRHQDSRDGFEVLFVSQQDDHVVLEGHTAAVEENRAWTVQYRIVVDHEWRTRSANVAAWTDAGRFEAFLETDGAGHWRVNGEPAPELDGCLDVDLESSATTNTLPVHRLHLAVGQSADAPAAYVRALDLGVERLEQRYTRATDRADRDDRQEYDYYAPSFAFEARLLFDRYGLVVEYPGIARRVL